MDARREAEQEAAEDRMSFTELADRDAMADSEPLDLLEAKTREFEAMLGHSAHVDARSAAYTATQDHVERAEARHEQIMHMSRTELINAALGAISSGRVDDDTLRDFVEDWPT